MENTTSVISLLPLHSIQNFAAIGCFTTPFRFFSPLILLAIITLFYLFKFQKPRIHEKKAKQHPLPPGPKPWPIIGCLPQMLKNRPTFRWIHKLMNEMNTEIACIRLGNVHVIPVSCPNISREFLKKQDAIFASRPLSMASQLTTKGYLTTVLSPYGEQWKKMKKVLATEVLSPAKHRWFYGKRLEEADHLVHYVYNQCKKAEGGLVNVRTATKHYCGNVIRKMVFSKRFFGEGMKDGGPGSEEEEHVNALLTILNYLFSFCISDYFPCLIGLDIDGHEKVMKEVNEIIRKYHDPIIEERVQQWTDGTKKEVEDLLDNLITLKDANGSPSLSTEEIKAQITEIMLAAVDNPSNSTEWAIAEMIKQPELLEKAVEELDKVVGKERLVQESDFSKLNYVKACIREAFRLHPVQPFNVPHISIADTTVANYFIPKGSHVLLSRIGLGQNPKVWDEPHKFKPQRHLKCDGSTVEVTEPDLRFISFSTGRRGCMGITLGTSMTVMLFARLLHGFSWSVSPNESSIDLTESKDSLFLAKPLQPQLAKPLQPLLAFAKPRLPAHVYLI